jgi:hypothetical protein
MARVTVIKAVHVNAGPVNGTGVSRTVVVPSPS